MLSELFHPSRCIVTAVLVPSPSVANGCEWESGSLYETSEDRRQVYHHIEEDTDADSDQCVRGLGRQSRRGQQSPAPD